MKDIRLTPGTQSDSFLPVGVSQLYARDKIFSGACMKKQVKLR